MLKCLQRGLVLFANLRLFLVLTFSGRAVSCAAQDGARAPHAQDRTYAEDAADAQHRSHTPEAQNGARAEYASHAQETHDTVWAPRAEQADSGPTGMMPGCFEVRFLIQHVYPENIAWWKSIIAPQERPV